MTKLRKNRRSSLTPNAARRKASAARLARSTEVETQEVPHSGERKENLAEAIRRRFAPFGGVELELPKRDAIRRVQIT